MSPSPLLAVALLGVWILVLFAATNAAAYAKWRDRQDRVLSDSRLSEPAPSRDQYSRSSTDRGAPFSDD